MQICTLWLPYPNAFDTIQYAAHHSTISILADLMTLLHLYLKTQFLECENPIVHTVQIDISALIALMKRNLRQVGTCWVLTVGRVDKLGLLEYAKLIYCQCVWQYWAKLPNLHLFADKMQRLLAYAIKENFEYCTIWINSIVSCFNSLINWTTIMNMYKTYWWPHADRHDP